MTTPRSSQPEWVRDHIRRYLETDGEDGHTWRGYPTLLLTHTGRKSGEQHTTPLIYGEHEGRYIVVASRGGAPEHPQWRHNLAADPSVVVQVRGERFRATARTADANERATLWRMMAEIYPPYDEYQERTTRQIPVVILERAE